MNRTITAITITTVLCGAGAASLVPGIVEAQSSTPRITDIDADLTRDGRVKLETETQRATRVTFTYRGRTVSGVRGERDDDGSYDWSRTVPARGGDAGGRNTATVKVRACAGSKCVTRSERERLEQDD